MQSFSYSILLFTSLVFSSTIQTTYPISQFPVRIVKKKLCIFSFTGLFGSQTGETRTSRCVLKYTPVPINGLTRDKI